MARPGACGLRRAVRHMSTRRLSPFVLVTCLCVSCAAPLPRPPAPELERLWQVHAGRVAPLSEWQLRGRLAVRIDERGGQASISWSRRTGHDQIRLNGPFGSGAVRIVQDGHGARLQDAENRELAAGSAEELLWLYTGWRLPVAHLDWWLRGLPVPELEARRELDEAGRLRQLCQQEWEVRYQSYIRVDRFDLPQQLTLTRAADAAAPAMEARIVIDRWQQVK